jgi:hypothetical protein
VGPTHVIGIFVAYKGLKLLRWHIKGLPPFISYLNQRGNQLNMN